MNSGTGQIVPEGMGVWRDRRENYPQTLRIKQRTGNPAHLWEALS